MLVKQQTLDDCAFELKASVETFNCADSIASNKSQVSIDYEDVFNEVITNNCFDLDFTDNEEEDMSMTCGSGQDDKLEQHVLVKCDSIADKRASKKRGLAAIFSEHHEEEKSKKKYKV